MTTLSLHTPICDTLNGSSGSSLFDNGGLLIGHHHYLENLNNDDDNNQTVHINQIIAHIASTNCSVFYSMSLTLKEDNKLCTEPSESSQYKILIFISIN